MYRNEKLLLSASEVYGHTFRHGAFMRLYEQSLFWFSVYIKPLKPMLERVKGGEPVVYGGLPVTSFEKLLQEGSLSADAIENGWTWRYAGQGHGADEDFSGFLAWRDAVLTAAASSVSVIATKTGIQKDILAHRLREGSGVGNRNDGIKGRDILYEIRAFNLAGSTPIQAMSAVADWQDFLRNWEGVG